MSNLTGQHTYGSGEISFARFLPDTQTPGAFRYIGNTTDFTLTASSESLDHFDSDHGVKIKDDSITTSSDLAGNIVTDNINQENVALYFTGTTSIVTDSSATGTIETVAAIQMGTYQMGASPSKPSGVRHISNVVVTDGATPTPVTYVAGVDYVVDGISGTIKFIEGGTIEAGDPAKITYDVAASTREQVISSNDTIEGALRFKAFNPKGPKRDYLLPYVRLTPDGDFGLKGDSWLTITYNLDVLRKGDMQRVYADGVAVTS